MSLHLHVVISSFIILIAPIYLFAGYLRKNGVYIIHFEKKNTHLQYFC